ncbi:unnamed protein product [Adineta ricciae]|uniref:Serine/threonine-protein kinase TOR n=1 Tax=Adineta ricciae TaxID=249248 RepID=A0A815Q4Y1_ADIRI|nr:unnamed protein product [Adineta ricciae]
MNFIFEQINSPESNQRQSAFHALGLMIYLDNKLLTKHMTKITDYLKETFVLISDRRYLSPETSTVACITLIGEGGREASQCLNTLLEYLLNCDLNHSVIFCLKKLCSMPCISTDIKQKIYLGLLKNLALILRQTNEQINMILIALQTLQTFDFEVQAIEPVFIDILHLHLIQHTNVRIRIESVMTVTHLLRHFFLPIASMKNIHIKLGLILHKLITIAITDLDPGVRYHVLLGLQDSFHTFLVKNEILDLLFFSINDRCHEIRELTIILLGRLSNVNPAYILPRLKQVLFQFLTDLTLQHAYNEKEQTLRLLGQLITNAPRLVQLYSLLISQVLLPLIKQTDPHSNAFITLIRTIGEYAHVCGIDFRAHLHDVFPILIYMLQDTLNARKRRVALCVTEKLIRSCCYVIEPFEKYPLLFDLLFQCLKSDDTFVRRQTIRLLGFIGAIDPQHIQSLNDHSSETNDITIIHRTSNTIDSIESSSNEHTTLAIHICLRVLQDSSNSNLHFKSIEAISKIFQRLGDNCTQYVPVVFPALLSVIQNTNRKNLPPYFHQMNFIIMSMKTSITPYMNDIIQLIETYSSLSIELQILFIHTIESVMSALENELHSYTHLLLPLIMRILKIDLKNYSSIDKQTILLRMFSTLNKSDRSLRPYLKSILLQILDIALLDENSIKVREEALNTFEHLAEKEFIHDYALTIVQILLAILSSTTQLQIKCLDTIYVVAQHMGKDFLIFSPLISKSMHEYSLKHLEYESYMSKLKDSPSDDQPQTQVNSSSVQVTPSTKQPTVRDPSMVYTMRIVPLRQHWLQALHRNATDLSIWLNKFQQLVLEQSPIYSLRAMGTCLAEHSSSISKELFNASFISCWNIMNTEDRKSLAETLTYVLSACDKADAIQIILNLVEYYEHYQVEKPEEQLAPLINVSLLISKAVSVRAYAKALRYTEMQFESQNPSSSDTVEKLISLNYELHQSEAAFGALEYAKFHKITIKDLWYEKLNQWERALGHYEFTQANDQYNLDIELGRMRCMQALGLWTELKKLTHQIWNITEPIAGEESISSSISRNETKRTLQEKVAPIAARAAWSVRDLVDMEKYSIHIPITQFEGVYYRAINAIRKNTYRQAQDSIDLAREFLDGELKTLTNESSSRGYSAMINAQLLSELEEVWEYKTRPERQQSICMMWQKRMEGNQSIIIDDYHRLLLTRSLCLPMIDDLQSWIKLASLCRRSDRLMMADFIFKQLTQTVPIDGNQSSQTFYHSVLLQYEKGKYDWHCLNKARERLYSERQSRHENSIRNNSPTNGDDLVDKLQQNQQEQLHLINNMKQIIHRIQQSSPFTSITEPTASALRRLTSRCFLRLGTWQHELSGMADDRISGEILINYERAWKYDESNYKAWNAYAVLNYDTVHHRRKEIQDLTHDTQHQLAAMILPCAVSSVKGLFRCIVLSKSKHCLQDTLRLLTILFEYGQYDEVYQAFDENMRMIPIDVWLQVLPQLIARIDSSHISIHQLIQRLLMNIGREHSQALIYPLVVASKSRISERKFAAYIVLNHMREHSSVLVQQAIIVSDELIKISILWHEKWRDGLGRALNQYTEHKDILGMIEQLKDLYTENCLDASNTLNERKFLDLYKNDLLQAYQHFCQFCETADKEKFPMVFQLYFQIYQRLHTHLQSMTALALDEVSPQLLIHCRDLELAIPGTYKPHKPPITIRNIHSNVKIITSKQRPRKISMMGSDGFQYTFLLKGHEDLRQDERVMQLFGLVNEFLTTNEQTRHQNFNIQRYPVIPLALNNGLLGWVSQCDTLHTLIKDHRIKVGIPLDIEYRHIRDQTDDYEQLPLINKVEIFENTIGSLNDDGLAKILWQTSSNAEVWLMRRSNYTRSLAVMSMVGYILGLGDRHLSNLMLDHASGKIVHIDFGDCFEVAMKREKFAEKVPFRLTRILCKAMEVTGINGTFRMTCEHVMAVLRKNRDSLMAVLEAFIHDPLLNWRLLSEPNSTASSLSTIYEEEREDRSVAQQQSLDIQTVEVINRVRDKLTGNDFHREQPVDIPTQVELLIKQATNHENLCQSYLGWCPFW